MDKLIDKMGAIGFSLFLSAAVWLVVFDVAEPIVKGVLYYAAFSVNQFVWLVGYVTYHWIGVGV